MPIRLYLDHHVSKVITLALRSEGIDTLTAFEDGSAELADPELLARATALGRVLFTRDDDFLKEAVRCQRENLPFAGLIYAHQLRVSDGVCVSDLILIAKVAEPTELANRIQYLPV